jgi:hypothetical protein
MIVLGLRRGDGVVICNFSNWYDNFKIDYIEGKCTLEGWLPPLRLVPDYYEVHVLVWPWGGGHLQGDLTRQKPLAWTTSDLKIEGGLNSHDGVFRCRRSNGAFNRKQAGDAITQDNINQALGRESQFYEKACDLRQKRYCL